MEKVLWKRKEINQPKKRQTGLKADAAKVIGDLPKYRFFKLAGSGGVVFILVILFAVSLSGVLRGNYFQIKNFEIYGIKQLSENDILFELKNYEGKNIFTQNPNSIKDSVTSTSIFLKDIYVEKNIPDTISIYVVERFPSAVVINFEGAYLVDQENVVIKVLSKTEGIDLSKDQQEVLAGFKLLNNKLIEDKLKEGLTEEEKTAFDITKVEDKRKKEVLTIIENELRAKIDELFTQNSKGVSTTEFANLPKVFVYNRSNYEIGQNIDTKFLNIPIELTAYFRSAENFTIDKMVWINNFTLSVKTFEGKEFIFSDRRDLLLQMDDLTYMLDFLEVEREEYSIIDVTSSVISVK